ELRIGLFQRTSYYAGRLVSISDGKLVRKIQLWPFGGLLVVQAMHGEPVFARDLHHRIDFGGGQGEIGADRSFVAAQRLETDIVLDAQLGADRHASKDDLVLARHGHIWIWNEGFQGIPPGPTTLSRSLRSCSIDA